MYHLKVFLVAILTATLGSAALAQFSGSNESGQQPTTGALGQQNSFSNVTTSFDGIDVQVRRLIEDPAGNGAVRLILLLTSTADKDRRLLFVGPATSLIDELGNVYVANSSVGIEICRYNHDWSPDFDWCRRDQGNIATRLASGVPVTVALMFQPNDAYSEELAKLSQTVSLRSRLAHYSDDLSEGKTADIIVNDIPFPR
ncbi:hypothetical protein LCL97_11425 [Seohaeicola saemankumensis]|nr:hypothetical protein [Seohaeicola saemankumensis]MCA0871439.1 hypothetical protein [Seohaeicola saemankumensis]